MKARRVASVALLAALVYLAVSAMPVAALQTNTVVGSIHDGPSDFETDSTLENTSVRGNNAGAVVQYSPGLINGFEDGDANVEPDGFSGPTGDAGAITVQNDLVINGSQSANVTANNADHRFTMSADHGRTDDVTQYFRSNNQTGASSDFVFYRWQNSSSTEILTVIFRYDGTIDITGDSTVSGGTWSEDAVYNVTVDWDFPNDQATVWINGSDTTVNLAAGAGNWQRLVTAHRTVGSGFDATATFDNYEFETPSGTPGTYISGNHSVSNASTGFTNFSALSDMEAIVTWQVSDGGPWIDFATNTYTTPGNKTIDLSAATNSTFRVNVTYNPTGSSPVGRMGDDGILFTNHEPQVKNPTASPTGDLSTSTPTLEVDVEDIDFGDVQGETVEVEFFVDGSSIGTDTLNANGTASMTTGSLSGGDHTWRAEATDSHGLTNVSQTFSISTPGDLTIRNETSPYGTVSGCNANVTFYESVETNPTIVQRSDADGDGTINLTGLPTGEEFVASIKCGRYNNRTVVIESLFEQKSAFLLHKNDTSVENRFTVEDDTGKFPASTTQIIIQRAINRSKYGGSPSGFTWTNVAGDDIGADQAFVTDLEEEERYRIVVRNQQGETRVLGAYVPEVAGTIPLQIGQVSIGGSTQAGAAVGATLREHEDGSRDVQVVYFDTQEVTTSLDIVIYNESDVDDEILNVTITDPSQRHVETAPVPSSAPDDVTYVVVVNATRNNATDLHKSIKVGEVSELFGDLNLNADVLSLTGWVVWFGFTGFFSLRSPDMAPAASVLLAFALTIGGVMFVDPVLLGVAGGIGVLVLVAGRGRV